MTMKPPSQLVVNEKSSEVYKPTPAGMCMPRPIPKVYENKKSEALDDESERTSS